MPEEEFVGTTFGGISAGEMPDVGGSAMAVEFHPGERVWVVRKDGDEVAQILEAYVEIATNEPWARNIMVARYPGTIFGWVNRQVCFKNREDARQLLIKTLVEERLALEARIAEIDLALEWEAFDGSH